MFARIELVTVKGFLRKRTDAIAYDRHGEIVKIARNVASLAEAKQKMK